MPESGNHVNISGPNNGPMIFGGVVHGDVTGGTIGSIGQDQGAELRELIGELRALVGAQELAKREIIDDSLQELEEAAQNPGEIGAAVPVSRWEKVKKLLGGMAEFAGLTVRISEQVTKLWPS